MNIKELKEFVKNLPDGVIRMGNVKLKPCPFCGNENIFFNRGYSSEIRNGFYLICGGCGISQALCGTKKACINKWNKRVDNSYE